MINDGQRDSLDQIVDKKLTEIRIAGVSELNVMIYELLQNCKVIDKKSLTFLLSDLVKPKVVSFSDPYDLDDYIKGLKKSIEDLEEKCIDKESSLERSAEVVQMMHIFMREKDRSIGVNGIDDGRSILYHSERVAAYSLGIAKSMGIRSNDVLRSVSFSGSLHDIGKLGVPDSILTKKTKLSFEEMGIMKKHTLDLNCLRSYRQKDYKDIIRSAQTHHERYDGSGYPNRLKDESIPYIGRIIAVADSFDAMTSPRPWNLSVKGYQEAYDEILYFSGKLYDPEITKHVDSLKPVYDKMSLIHFN